MNNLRKMGKGFTPDKTALMVGGAVGGLGLLGAVGYNSLFNVTGGHRAVIFSRISGVQKEILGEGLHFVMPWVQIPYIFDTRIKPIAIRSPTGSKDLQTVDITLRVLYKPVKERLPQILSDIGTDYDHRVLHSIVNETLKSVVAQFNASQLITQREKVSMLIRRNLTERARDFNIIIDDVSITHTTFGKEYTAAVEAKQVAQQDAEKAKFTVQQARQDKLSTIIKAQGEAKSAEMIGAAVAKNPGYIQLRQLDSAKVIANTLMKSPNRLVLDSDSLLLNVLQEGTISERLKSGGK